METKQLIRKCHISQRNQLPEAEAERLSSVICKNLTGFFYSNGQLKSLGAYGYYPYGKETSLVLFYEWLLENEVPLAFPRVSGETMEFYQVFSMDEFEEGAFHIMEPKESCKQALFERAFCFVPGSVFDRAGNRLGYGKGYYDRYFAKHKDLYRVGIAYESQIEEEIPSKEGDIAMQALATENGIRFF